MDSNTYQKQFSRTLAPVFFPQNVCPIFLGVVLSERKRTADLVDAAKRGLFYNKTDRLETSGHDFHNDLNLPFDEEPELIHAVLGLESEIGEIQEAAFDSNLTEEQRRARILDESGDLLWYLALLFKQFNISFEEAFAANIAKLAKRYPDKFTIEDAVNRDLEAEEGVFNDFSWLPEETIKLDGAVLTILDDTVVYTATNL